jgi:hypothetical protein
VPFVEICVATVRVFGVLPVPPELINGDDSASRAVPRHGVPDPADIEAIANGPVEDFKSARTRSRGRYRGEADAVRKRHARHCPARSRRLYEAMAYPAKTDATTLCPKCSGVMKITMVEPLPDEPKLMQHTFVCGGCKDMAQFKFEKRAST